MSTTVIYNGYTLPNVYDKVFFSQGYDSLVFRCSFFIRESSSSGVVSEEGTMLAMTNEPFERLQVSFNSTSEFDIDHDANTALNPYVSVKKSQGNKNNEASREYEFEYKCMLPARKSGFNFRQTSTFTISRNDARRRTINFSISYTAGGANSSRSNFDTFAEPYVLGVVAAIGGNYENVSDDSTTEDQEKITTGKFSFVEVLEDDLDGTVNDSRITSVSTDYSVNFGQSIGVSLTGNYVASPQNKITISYKVKYNSSSVSAGAAAGIYNTEIKPYVLNQAFSRLDLNTKTTVSDFFITEDDGYSFNPNDFSFSGKLSLLAPQDRNAIISLKETITNDVDDGILATKVWDQKANTYALYKMGSTERFSRITEIIKIGSEPDEPERIETIGEATFIRQKISRRKHVEDQGVGELIFDSTTAESHEVFFVQFSESYLRVDEVANQAVIEGPGEEIGESFAGVE